jgi:4-hydroxy-tetrahydrodipicolinate synthase
MMIQGGIVALVTPMRTDGSVDNITLRRLAKYHVDNGTDAIVAVGTTGESSTLDYDEHCEVIRIIIDQVSKRVPVIAGTGSNSTREAIDLAQHAKGIGADASLSVVPYYNKPTHEGLYRHFKAIAETVDMPHILYNVPGRTGCDMLPETVKRLAQIPNIVGIKEAGGSLDRIRELVAFANDSFAVYSGDDATAMETILLGGKGDISVTANVAPKAMHEMCQLALAGDRAGAEAINQRLVPLHKALFLEPNPIPVKWAVQQLGLIAEGIRLPLTPLSEKFYDAVKQAMQSAQVI